MKNELINVNLIPEQFSNFVDHEYVPYYLRINEKGLSFGNIKQIDDNMEIIFDIQKKEIISIKIIKK